jgi:hypothetical protein
MHTREARLASGSWVRSRLQRVQECNDLLLLVRRQETKPVRDAAGFAFVPGDRILERQRSQIMHVTGLHPQALQRRRAHFIGCILRPRLHDSVSGSYVVQQVISEGMNCLVGNRRLHGICAAINRGAFGRSRD